MKKLFLLAAVFAASMAMNAAVVYDWAGSVGSTTVKQESGNGSVDVASSIAIKGSDVAAIKFTKGYSSKSGETYYYNYIIIKPAEGGFKKGDVLKFTGVINNDGSDASKVASLRVRVQDDKGLWDSENVKNVGLTTPEDPVEQSYTLEADADELHCGRQGKTNLFIISLKVERTATALDNAAEEVKAVKTFENGQLVIIKNGVKYNATGAVVR